MTKTLTKTTLALLALGMAVPAMAATDGGLGATSTGTMTVSAQVNPPAAETVHIFALEDLILAPINRVAGQQTSSTSTDTRFCTHATSTAFLSVTQAGGASPNGGFSLNGAGGKSLDAYFRLPHAYNSSPQTAHGFKIQLSGTDINNACTAGNKGSNGTLMSFYTTAIPADSTIADGALSQTFTLTMSVN
jgi:hypothetical protein